MSADSEEGSHEVFQKREEGVPEGPQNLEKPYKEKDFRYRWWSTKKTDPAKKTDEELFDLRLEKGWVFEAWKVSKMTMKPMKGAVGAKKAPKRKFLSTKIRQKWWMGYILCYWQLDSLELTDGWVREKLRRL